MIKNSGLLTVILFILTGCSTNEMGGSEQQAMIVCTDPRPAMCTMDYTPVCGLSEDETYKTYSNACGACSNAVVVSYMPQACAENHKSENHK